MDFSLQYFNSRICIFVHHFLSLFIDILYYVRPHCHTFLSFFRQGFFEYTYNIWLKSSLSKSNVWASSGTVLLTLFSPCVWAILSCFFTYLILFFWMLDILDSIIINVIILDIRLPSPNSPVFVAAAYCHHCSGCCLLSDLPGLTLSAVFPAVCDHCSG